MEYRVSPCSTTWVDSEAGLVEIAEVEDTDDGVCAAEIDIEGLDDEGLDNGALPVRSLSEGALVPAAGSRLMDERSIEERAIPVRVGVIVTVAAPAIAGRVLVAVVVLELPGEVFAPVVDKINGGVRSTTVPRSETGA